VTLVDDEFVFLTSTCDVRVPTVCIGNRQIRGVGSDICSRTDTDS
jgi:hypothetical protein